MLIRQSVISTWHDRRLLAGDSVDNGINGQLENADIILRPANAQRLWAGRVEDSGIPEKTGAEVNAILTEAMAESGATPAAVYAFHKTGVYVTDENEGTLSPERLRAWSDAIDEYELLASRPNVVV
jgi:hypothetical protein